MNILTLNLDEKINKPMYIQIYEQIKEKIIHKEILENEKLPAKRILAKQLDVGINTVENAYLQLIDEGYIVTIERAGYYVVEIDNLFLLYKEDNEVEKVQQKSSSNNIFKYSGIDTEFFPYNTFYKLNRDVIADQTIELLNLDDPRGYLPLREEIVKYLNHSRMIKTTADNIIISAGSEYLFQILFQILPRDYLYGIEDPGYERLNNLFLRNNIKYTTVSLDQYGMNHHEIVSQKINVACITPSHQFPLGIIMPIKRRMEIINWALSSKNHYIVEDDYNSEFKYIGKPIPALKSLVNSDQIIYISSFSKSIAPGFRTSFMVVPNNLMNIFLNSSSNFICPVSIYTQKLLMLFIKQGYFEKHINKMRKLYKEKRDIIVELFSKYNNIEILGAEAGIHFIVKVSSVKESILIKTLQENDINIDGLTKYYQKPVATTDGYLLFGYGAIKKADVKIKMQEILTIFEQAGYIKRK
ncbi:PLP-dependent aminotransferase family protein [Erysipelotrichaceae bacterium OttesenSCG-928-M19]|nr:PLP-dependent aminotransferase family protein [Erysipelotrichaceae bacterium OttesenSCG-928-M19]